MKKEEALQVITGVCEKVIGTKQDHIIIEQALTLLKSELEKVTCDCKESPKE